MGKRVKTGDVIEIPIGVGFAYAQVAGKDSRLGTLLLVFEGQHASRPALAEALSHPVQFECFLPLQAAVNREIFEVVGNEALRTEPPHRFKARGFIDRDGTVKSWDVIDGDDRQTVEALSDEEKKLPYRSIINDTLLIERIESGWRNDTGL